MLTSQRTINGVVNCNGIGLHSGLQTKMSLIPAPTDHGIVFRRTDLNGVHGIITAHYKNVVDTNLGTTISNEFGNKVSTIEHLMAAIWGCGIDNLIVEISSSEIPIMDGSSESFVFMVECAGVEVQDAPRKFIEIVKEVVVKDGDSETILTPAEYFSIDSSIEFSSQIIASQRYSFSEKNKSFKHDIARARTFGFEHEGTKS